MAEEKDVIEEISGVSLAQLSLDKLLERIAGRAAEALNAQACAILVLDEEGQTLSFRGSRGFNTEAINAVRVPKDRGISWRIVRDRRPVTLLRASDDPDYYNVPESGEDKFTSLLGAPIMDGAGCVGAMYVQTTQPREFTPAEIESVEMMAGKTAGAIRAAAHIERLGINVANLSALNELAQLMRDTEEIPLILEAASRCAANLTGARNQIIWLCGENGDPMRSHSPESVGDAEYLAPVRLGIVMEAIRSRKMINVDDIRSGAGFAGLERVAALSVAVQPMIYKDKPVGAILLSDRIPAAGSALCAPFTGGELKTLAEIASFTAQAVMHCREHELLETTMERSKRDAKELAILLQVSVAMQQTITLDDLLLIILSSVTVGSGLGFNRAALFLANKHSGHFHGMLGIGPDSGEEAGRIWSKAESAPPSGDDLLKWLLDRSNYQGANSRFNEATRSIRMSMAGQNALARASIAKTCLNIKGRRDMTAEDSELVERLGCDSFAVAPLVTREGVQGAIIVDNKFNNRPITDYDMDILTRFSSPAAWAIENVKLVGRLSALNKELSSLESHLAQVERMSALGEISAELAHEIKNPLVTIGGFARRLLWFIPSQRMESRYASRIVQEVERLEGILRSTLDASKGISGNRRLEDVNRLARDVFDLFRRAFTEAGVESRLALEGGLPQVMIDSGQIKQTLINLIHNAMDAMACDKHPNIRKIFEIRTARSGADSVSIIISDTGGGVTERDLNDIFNPFFTTKQTGTGLGLSLCKKIVRLHKGTMTIDNRLGVGVTFTITLPGAPPA